MSIVEVLKQKTLEGKLDWKTSEYVDAYLYDIGEFRFGAQRGDEAITLHRMKDGQYLCNGSVKLGNRYDVEEIMLILRRARCKYFEQIGNDMTEEALELLKGVN